MPDEYPEYLIPYRNLRILLESELDPNHHIGIWVDKDVQLKDENNRLNGGAINLHHIPHFSNNKIPHSAIRDLNIKFNDNVKNLYSTLWVEGTDGIMPNQGEFFFEDDRNHYFIKISDINGYTDTYEKSDTTYTFTVNLVHKPTTANYWHFEFKISSDGNEVDYNGRKWVNDIIGSIRGNLVKKAIFEI
jgi:hypothetical protein